MPARNLYLTPSAIEALGDRTSGNRDRSAVASRMLERYAEACRRHLPDFSESEWNLLRDALNGWTAEPAASVAWLVMGVADAIKLGELADKWEVDGAALLARLEQLDYAGCCAVLDAVERWWARRGLTLLPTGCNLGL